MKRAEAEKLLGGYATGTLTEAERRTLFEAALEHQDVFDSLADEEALRELLADPAARAHVLAALAPRAGGGPPKVVPFWRRPGVIGAAAGILMAATAGLAVLRSPEAQGPLPAAKPEAAQAPLPVPSASAPAAPKETPPPTSITEIPAQKAAAPHRAVAVVATESPAPLAQGGAAQAGVAPAADGAVRAEARQAEAQDQMARKAEAAGRNRAYAVTEVLSLPPESAPAPGSALGSAPGSAPAAAPPPRVAAKAAAPPTAGLHAPQAPIWTLESLADGTTRLTVLAFRQAQVVLLRRGAGGVEVLKPATAADADPWQFQLRLAPGDVLDLYVLDRPVADPARLPETGPVDGFRARVHPPAKK